MLEQAVSMMIMNCAVMLFSMFVASYTRRTIYPMIVSMFLLIVLFWAIVLVVIGRLLGG